MNVSTLNPLDELKQTVIDGGYCIGCGACTMGLSDAPIQIQWNNRGQLQASVKTTETLEGFDTDSALAACPFSDNGENEDTLAHSLFGDIAGIKQNDSIGYYLSTFAGHVSEGEFRNNGSSGGMGSWILSELLRTGEIDAVLHVKETGNANGQGLFEFSVSSSVDEVCAGAKSRYYPIEMSQVLGHVRENPGRYAIVGIPCFAKAIRQLQKIDAVFAERIKFVTALFCGHLKSKAFVDLFGWQLGIEPGNVTNINFRKKIPENPASDYGIEIEGTNSDGQVITQSAEVKRLYGTNWGLGYFKYKACDYCDDVVGETADVSVGDAWLPQYESDSGGTNVVVVRHPLVLKLVYDAIKEKRLSLDLVTADVVAESQEGGLRHRRDGLAYRLHLADQKGTWRPKKRVQPNKPDDARTRFIFKQRIILADKSHKAWKRAKRKGSFVAFRKSMRPNEERYADAYVKSDKPWHVFRTTQVLKRIARRTKLTWACRFAWRAARKAVRILTQKQQAGMIQ